MASSPPWFGWLGGLVSGLVSSPPAPGTHEATLEELRVGALLNKEALKPAEQRDEERVHKLRVEYRQRQLANTQARVVHCATNAALAEMPATRQCCAARAWVRQRAAASYRAQHDFYSQLSQQITEELAAAEAWRPAGIVAQPTLRLDLPGALQQPPPRVDMCSGCAGWIQELELAEQSRRVHAEALVENFKRRGMQAAPAASAASQAESGTAAAATAAAVATAAAAAAGDVPAGERQNCEQQQQQQQQQQQPTHGGAAGDVAGGSGSAPVTPKHLPLPRQPQHASSDQEQEEQQELGAAEEGPPLLPEEQRQQQQHPPQ